MSDLISRQDAIELMCRALEDDWESDYAADRMNELPSAEPERKKGEWIPENRRPKSWSFYCSVCHRTAYDPQNHHNKEPKRCRYAFCPNCGAYMRGKGNDKG